MWSAIFLAQDGAVQVRDAAELEKVLGELLADDPRVASNWAQCPAKSSGKTQGAIDRTVDMIVQTPREAGTCTSCAARSERACTPLLSRGFGGLRRGRCL